ncbi:OLC1v1032613C1 [Oldenlandia corymbosa var. corymbosa]|uniref:OLC1v1032613C1 n=1 Tax=Oldenlandia corymbosa var. corymbosa TaxID=529605 RepID=A0AAV1CN19_OLDCO|nr:OLC1v1032613C1 [Oldenlandia corymbosa var. corymbosa]
MKSEKRSGSSKHSSVAEEEEDMVGFDESLHSDSQKSKNSTDVTKDDLENVTSELKHSHTKSSSEDYFQIDPNKFPTSEESQIDPTEIKTSEPVHQNSPPKEENTTSSKVEERKSDDVEGGTLHELEETSGSSRSFSQNSVVTHESLAPTLSPTKSPAPQVMERPAGYDPNRISAAIFSKPPGPLDWSVASNESLFSIRIGSMSFARDRKLGGDSHTRKNTGISGDFDYSSDWYRSGELKSPSELVRLRQHSPAKFGADHRLQCIDSGKSQVFGKLRESVHDEAFNNQGRIDPDEAYSLTDESKSNTHSCASPMKNSPSPYLCNWCSCTCCSCKQLCCGSCLPKCPHCSGYSCEGLCNWSSCCCSQKSLGRPSYSCNWPGGFCFDCSCCCHQRLGGSRWPNCCPCSSLCEPSFSCCKWPSCSSCNCSKPKCPKSCCNLC